MKLPVSPTRFGFFLYAALALLASGCASVATAPAARPDDAADCAHWFREADRVVERAKVRDGQAAPLRDFPYLRVDRFLASFAQQPLSVEALAAWGQRLRTLDQEARRIELVNLTETQRERLRDSTQRVGLDLSEVAQHCGRLLLQRDLADPQRRLAMLQQAQVPDDYDTWKRVLGVYAVTKIPFAAGVRDYQRQTEATFRQPLENVAVTGRLQVYVPAEGERLDSQRVAQLLREAPRDALGMIELNDAAREQLFATYAPLWIVDQASDDDRIGTLSIDTAGRAQVELGKPTVYRRLAFTRYQGEILPQLVYSAWFPARPKTSAFDTLGGQLDGLLWRVTLAADGAPLVFDSMHSCGCYHQFFPTTRARLLAPRDTLDEQAFAPQALGEVAAGQVLALRIASRSHYLQRVLTAASAQGRSYHWDDDDALRSLAGEDGRRSAFRPDGIVAGSERLERYLFWPMGVRSAGAMRQWGRHATAFVGRRHFDDAWLMQEYFEFSRR